MKTITFHLTAVQPLLLTSLQGDPNSSVSFPYIPGSVIRGALIGQYVRNQGEHSNLDLDNPVVQRWFFDGTTCYLNAYPLIKGERSIPIPRSLAAEKTADLERDQLMVFDRSVAMPEDIPLRSMAGFIARDQHGEIRYTTTRKLINIHNQRDRPRGRGVDGAGAVFRYEAIASEQTFAAVIICDDQDVTTIQGLLPERLWLGGSRSAGYGEVRIDVVEMVDTWSEVVPQPLPEEDREDESQSQVLEPLRLTITLTSDMLLRAAHGEYTTAPPREQIEATLGVKLTPEYAQTSLGTILQGGFNRTWGLPLPQTPALAAGSVLTYSCDTPPSAAALAQLEAASLGERRAEGFGRVVCNLLSASESYTLRRWKSEDDQEPATQATTIDNESRELAELMAQRILAARLETRLIEQAAAHKISNDSTISNTQLSRLRIIARRALSSGSLKDIETFLNALPANARNQFERAMVGNQSLDQWIRRHLVPVPTDWHNDKLKVSVANVILEPD